MTLGRRDLLGGLALGPANSQPSAPPWDLEKLCHTYKLPAVGVAVIERGQVRDVTVHGVRKLGDPTQSSPSDRFHLGSCTKAMTATLIGECVDEGKLGWDTKLGDLLKDLRLPAEAASVTVEQLMHHRGGFPTESFPRAEVDWWTDKRPVRELRRKYVEAAARLVKRNQIGNFAYSNAGYVALGAILEKLRNQEWEEVCRRRLFGPLGMNSSGFGPPSSPGKTDQPWPHRREFLKNRPIPRGPGDDNPRVLGPAGRAHASLEDFARFGRLHLLKDRLLKPETFQRLHTPGPGKGDPYAGGWLVVDRDWAQGPALTHAGSNTVNYALVWLAPNRGFGCVAATNIGGDRSQVALDSLIGVAIQHYLR